ncbi:MAG: OmpA family protein [Proteobacteria bacterium]|nr:OmpA family protein [Pseudomonadota bacterium]
MKNTWIVLSIAALTLLAALPAGADCDKGRMLYQQAMKEQNPAKKVALLGQSAAECRNFAVSYELGRAYARMDNLDQAEQALRDARDMAPSAKTQAMALAGLGRIYAARGRDQDAAEYLRLSYQKYPLPEVLEEMAKTEKRAASRPMSAARIKQRLIEVEADPGGKPSLEFRNINFETDKYELNAPGRVQADELGKALADPELARMSFLIIGHTDKRGETAYNQVLSERRAGTVRKYLLTHYRIAPERLEAEGRGESEPIASGDTADDYFINRRVEVKIRKVGDGPGEARRHR